MIIIVLSSKNLNTIKKNPKKNYYSRREISEGKNAKSQSDILFFSCTYNNPDFRENRR